MTTPRGTVLLFDDPECAADRATVLRDLWPVRTCYDLETAVESLDDDVTAALVGEVPADDRQEFLERAAGTRPTLQVGVVGADAPPEADGTIAPDAADAVLQHGVARLLRRAHVATGVREHYQLAAEYVSQRDDRKAAEMRDRLDGLQAQLNDIIAGLDSADAFSLVLGDDDTDGVPDPADLEERSAAESDAEE
jgi:hypothetical protein